MSRKFAAICVLFAGMLLLLLLAIPPSASGEQTRAQPNAYFTYSPSSPVKGQNVTFNAGSSSGTGQLNYSWTFGDGSVGHGMLVKHAYKFSGTYRVYLIVSDEDGGTDTASKSIYVYASEPYEESEELMWGFLAFYGICLIYELLMLLVMLACWIANIVIMVKLYRTMNQAIYETGAEEELKTYRTIVLIIGILGIVMVSFIFYTIIFQLIVYLLFKNKLDSIRGPARGAGRRPPGPPPWSPPPLRGQPAFRGPPPPRPRKARQRA